MKSSNELLDLRVRRTYKFLWDALLSLMQERELEAITVTDICERAMVHRTTFYKHYEDKYGLLFHGIQDELNALFEAVENAGSHSLHESEKANHPAQLIAMLDYVRKREAFYRMMLTGNGFEKFGTLLRKSLIERFERRLQHEGKTVSKPTALHIHLQAAGIVSMIAWWLENDCPYTPEELVKYAIDHIDLVK